MSVYFSIIIPVHNSAKTLADCLLSIINQTYPTDKFEVIVVNDRSTDSSVEIAKQYNAKIVTGKFSCIPAVRNFGSAQAKGEILVHLDSDMVFENTLLSKAEKYFRDENLYGALGFADDVPDDASWIAKIWYSPSRTRANIKRGTHFLASRNLFINKKLFDEIGGFDEELFKGRKAGSDKELTIRIFLKGYKVITDPTVKIYHMGYEKNLINFIKKEYWHQGHTLFIAKKYNYIFRLMKNPILSFYHLILILGLLLSFPMRNISFSLLLLITWFTPTILIILKRMDFIHLSRSLPVAFFITFLRWNVAAIALIPQFKNLLFPRKS